MLTFLVIAAIAACFLVPAGVACFHYGYALAEKRHLRDIVDTEQDMRVRVLGDLYARIDAGGEPLSLEFFEQRCHTTVASKSYGTADWFAHICFKLFGEAGEFSEHVGKAIRDDEWSPYTQGAKGLNAERRMALLKELGDILWYVVMIAKELGSNLAEVALINIKKREGRKQRGTLKGSGDDR